MVTKLDLVKDRAIIRGALWDLLTILRQGDLTALQCRGQIRDGEDGELFANFEFEPLTTVDRDGVIYTRIKPYLGATRTKQIPTTAPRQTWFYDIERKHCCCFPIKTAITEFRDPFTCEIFVYSFFES